MASEWKHISLRDAGVTLIDCDHRTPPAVDSGYPYVSIPQLRQGRIEIDDARKITAEHFEEWTRKAKPQAYDVVLSRRCNPGETAFVSPHMEFALGQNLVLLRADGTKVYPPFLRWLVRGPDWWAEVQRFINVGAVFNSLRCADVPKFLLPIPMLSEQRSIDETLGALDDKIALLRETNATLEAIAQALFKSWFVDFDPVRARRDGRDPIGVPPEVADLFPSAFEDSALGAIPKGWRVMPFSDTVEILGGGTPREALNKYPFRPIGGVRKRSCSRFVQVLADPGAFLGTSGVLHGFFHPIFPSQDATFTSSANNQRRASTRLAKPNSVNNCAVFFSRPR